MLFPFLLGGAFIEAQEEVEDEGGKWYFPSFLEGLSLRRVLPLIDLREQVVFPFLLGGAFIEAPMEMCNASQKPRFPFLLGGAFIEASIVNVRSTGVRHFPSILEGLSLRPRTFLPARCSTLKFPFLLGGAFIEAAHRHSLNIPSLEFPFLLGGAFIEAIHHGRRQDDGEKISLPSWRGFH